MANPRPLGPTLLPLLVCLLPGTGCSGGRPSDGHDGGSTSAASAWAGSDDGRLSLRIITAHGPIGADEAFWVLVELRNDSDEPVAVLRPPARPFEAGAGGFEVTGPGGRASRTGPWAASPPEAGSFAHLGTGYVLQEWLRLDMEDDARIDAAGRYTLRYAYRATPDDREAAGRFAIERLWTGEIRTGAVTLTKEARPSHGRNGGVESAVSVRIPGEEYRFTAAEAAAGVRFDYDIVVARDLEGVVPLPQDVGGAQGPGPSGLTPFERIEGGGQSYCRCDIGLAPPGLRRPGRIERGTYPHSFGWDGRNWGGPSDTGTPKGEPFPPGDYTLRVRVTGEVEMPEGRRPYDVSDTARVVLTP